MFPIVVFTSLVHRREDHHCYHQTAMVNHLSRGIIGVLCWKYFPCLGWFYILLLCFSSSGTSVKAEVKVLNAPVFLSIQAFRISVSGADICFFPKLVLQPTSLFIYIYIVIYVPNKKQGEPADPKAKRSAQPRKNIQTHISRPKRSISPLQASWQP